VEEMAQRPKMVLQVCTTGQSLNGRSTTPTLGDNARTATAHGISLVSFPATRRTASGGGHACATRGARHIRG
jgi:hypothetical protein